MSQSPDDLASVIAKHGKSIGGAKPKAADLESRIDGLELAIEEAGQTASLVSNLNNYVTELRGDLKAVRSTRFWIVVLSIFFIVSANGGVFFLIFHHGVWFWLQDTYFKSVVIVSVMTASVVLLSIMLKGAFHSLAERAKDDNMPPHLKEAMDAVKLALGR